MEGLSGQLLGISGGVADVDVVEEDILGHAPDLEADTTNLVEVRGRLVLEVVGVGDLARSPGTLVVGVVNEGSGPLALELGVGLGRSDPFATARSLLALGVGNGGGDPVSIFLIVPLFGLLCVRVRDLSRLVLQPAFGNDSLRK